MPLLLTRHFLGWNRSVLELSSEWLAAHAQPRWPDLSGCLTVVPTRHAGRRLRERLAHLAHRQGAGILPPKVVPPEALISLVCQPRPGQGCIASPEESVMAWAEVLLRADLAEFPALFPVPPVSQDLNWALGTADSLIDLRRSLGEAGLEIRQVGEIVGDDLEETERWHELSRFERHYQDALARRGLADHLSARSEMAARPELPGAISCVAMLACPDPLPLAVQVLEALAAAVPVHVLIHAPASMEDAFDAWGRPVVPAWSTRSVSFSGFDRQVQVMPGPLAQAEAACRRTLAYRSAENHVAIGVLDEEVAPLLEERLDAHNIPSFNPQGLTLRSHGAIHLLRTLRDLLREPSFATYLELLRCADYAAWLAGAAEGWDQATILEGYDELARKHLPQTLRDLRRVLNQLPRSRTSRDLLRFTFQRTRAMLRDLARHPLPQVLPALLSGIFSVRLTEAGSERIEALQTASQKIPAILESMAGGMGQNLPLRGAAGLDLLLRFLESESLYPDRPAGAVDLLGWLELPWEDAPHLIVTGFNEGFVPDSIVGDIYLPERLRAQLARHVSFKTNEQRFARDAYLLESMLQSRSGTGGLVELFLGKRSLQGEPLRPSRLLFLCPDRELANRTERLFGDIPEPGAGTPWTAGFTLFPAGRSPSPEPVIRSLSVTAFRDYLESPFRFYLRHVERMRAVPGQRMEMDAAAFGELLHESLRRLGQDEVLRDSANERELGDFLVAQIDDLLVSWFGPEPALPLRIQGEAARQRLRAAARVQAVLRQQGWRIAQVETVLGGGSWMLDGVAIAGRVDRIDRHEATGAIRVLDYKTSDNPKPPRETHLALVTAATRKEWLPDYAVFEADGKTWRWKDLQLPLYRLGLAQEFGADIECGYFNLPKSGAETKVDTWASFAAEHEQAARHCASGILEDVLRGRFWPAPASAWEDDFVSLHLGRPEQTVNPSRLQPA